MTPRELLELVKSQFVTLYHDEPEKLDALMFLALTEYQDRAGVMQSLTLTHEQQINGGIELPPLFMSVLSAHDVDHNFHETKQVDRKLNVVTTRYSVAPYTIQYLMSLSDLDFEEGELPQHAIGLIQKYLKVLIEIPNTERERYARESAQLPTDGLPHLPDLHEKKEKLEEQMDELGNLLMPSMLLGL